MSRELVAQDGDPVNLPAVAEIGLQLGSRASIIYLLSERAPAVSAGLSVYLLLRRLVAERGWRDFQGWLTPGWEGAEALPTPAQG